MNLLPNLSPQRAALVAGHSTCSVAELDGPAIWTVKVVDGKVAVWQVDEDTEENRKVFGL